MVTFSFGQSVGLAKAGKIKMLAVGGDTRSPLMPDIPSYKEAGMDFTIQTWFALYAPAGTPHDLVQRLNSEMVKALNSPEMKERMALQGMDPAPSTPAELAAFVKAETAKWAKAAKDSGATAE